MEERPAGSGQGPGAAGVSIKQVGVVLGVVLAIALGVVVGKQMSTEAMAVVVGVVCGVAAGIPTSVLLVVALNRRERQHRRGTERQTGQGGYPPVVVIQGGGQSGLLGGPQTGYWPVAQPGPLVERQFHMIGGDDLVVDG